MQPQTLYDKLWSSHVVREEADGTALIYIDRHLGPRSHEPPGLRRPEARRAQDPGASTRVVATADHNTPTQGLGSGHP